MGVKKVANLLLSESCAVNFFNSGFLYRDYLASDFVIYAKKKQGKCLA